MLGCIRKLGCIDSRRRVLRVGACLALFWLASLPSLDRLRSNQCARMAWSAPNCYGQAATKRLSAYRLLRRYYYQ